MSSKVYVGGKTHNFMLVRTVQGYFTMWGWEISHDWTRIVQEVGGPANERGVPKDKQGEYARNDLYGVYTADIVVIVAPSHPSLTLCGTLVEMGAALAWDKPVWLLGQFFQESVFFEMPNCTRLPSMAELAVKLEHIGPVNKLLEGSPAKPMVIPKEEK